MKVLRTPDKYFTNIKGYPFDPIYTDIFADDGTEIRIHHIDEGPSDGPILLAMHGQPVWSYLYSKMIPILNDSGIRVIAPDLVGYGKSDKPASRNDYSYQNQVDWMNQWLVKNNLNDLIFFGQDWGGLIGLRMIVDNPDRFTKISMGNTGLPYMPNTPKTVIDEVHKFRKSNIKLTPLSMAKEVKKMDSGKSHPALKFMYWQKFCWDTKNLPVGLLNSMMMEKLPKNKIKNHYIFYKLGLSKISPYISERKKARDIRPEIFKEIFIKASIDECKKRDVKGLYSKAISGEIENFTGISSPYEDPKNPDLVLNTEKESIEESVKKLENFIIKEFGMTNNS